MKQEQNTQIFMRKKLNLSKITLSKKAKGLFLFEKYIIFV